VIRENIVEEAAIDYRFLLDRGYSRNDALSLVAKRYGLTPVERMALYRGVHRSFESSTIFAKIVNPVNFVLDKLVIDMYNTVITIVAALRGQPLVLGDDCLVRDLRGSKLHHSEYSLLEDAIHLLSLEIAVFRPKSVVVVAESQISHSAEQAVALCRCIEALGVRCTKIVTPTVDSTIVKISDSACVVATTDTVIALRVPHIYPLTTVVALKRMRVKPSIDFSRILRSPCRPLVERLV